MRLVSHQWALMGHYTFTGMWSRARGRLLEAGSPPEPRAFQLTAERGVYFATYRGSFIAVEAALESAAGVLAA